MNRSEQSEEERIQAEQRAEEGWQRRANGAKVSASERATDAWRRLELELESRVDAALAPFVTPTVATAHDHMHGP